eukprot:gene17976-16053_t
MGCGSSKAADVTQKATAELTALHAAAIAKAPQQTEDAEPSPHADAREDETITAKIDFVLASHISAVLGIDPSSPEIKKYVSVLRHQGWDTPDDFDELSTDELKAEPFFFKPGHLKKVTRSREKGKRGECSVCGGDVLDTQPRTKDQDTGKYQHQDCHARSSRSISPPHAAHSATSRTGALGADSAAANDAARDCAAEKAKAEVAALLAAVEAARAELGAIAEAKQQAEAALAETEARAVTASSQTPSTISGPADAVRGFESTLKSGPSSAPRTKLPAAGDLKTTTLLPDSKHAFLSYQWDVQENVKEIK